MSGKVEARKGYLRFNRASCTEYSVLRIAFHSNFTPTMAFSPHYYATYQF